MGLEGGREGGRVLSTRIKYNSRFNPGGKTATSIQTLGNAGLSNRLKVKRYGDSNVASCPTYFYFLKQIYCYPEASGWAKINMMTTQSLFIIFMKQMCLLSFQFLKSFG